MNIDEIIATLEQERDRLNDAIAALSSGRSRRRGRGRRRPLTAAEKHRISVAMKRRWAERKKAK